jgi:lipopolysaccharide transport system ATP-binding protein
MIADEQGAFERIFEHCEIDVPAETRRALVEANSFETKSGRKRGEEDATKHHRKGIAGDWRNYFTPEVKQIFKERLGEALVAAGYEKGLEW